MNDFEKLLARFGGSIFYQLSEGKPWSECTRSFDPKEKAIASKLKVEFIDKHKDEFQEDRQGWEGTTWAVYKYDGKYYQVNGEQDSYGRERYLGFHEVEGVEVTVVKFKPKN
jgi:hypothetical protein